MTQAPERVIHARLANAVHKLHAFQKTTQSDSVATAGPPRYRDSGPGFAALMPGTVVWRRLEAEAGVFHYPAREANTSASDTKPCVMYGDSVLTAPSSALRVRA